MPDILSTIVEVKRQRLAEAMSRIPLAEMQALASTCPQPAGRFSHALRPNDGLHIIAEIKRASPSKGAISAQLDPVSVAKEYVAAGATAISVLTEEDHFRGSLDDLRRVRASVEIPLLRKDFIFDEYQVLEAVVAGADAVLLIVACLDDARLRELLRSSRSIGLDALVEVHNEDEMRRAINAGAEIVGINNRNLKTFEVNLETSLRLAPLAPRDCILVAESGIANAADAGRLASAGFRNFLVGESVVRSTSRHLLFSELLAAGRSS